MTKSSRRLHTKAKEKSTNSAQLTPRLPRSNWDRWHTKRSKAAKRHAPGSTFRLGFGIDAAMDRLWERDGIPPSEQARRALTAWLTEKGVPPKPDAPRTKGTR
jgi:hypothetical protein